MIKPYKYRFLLWQLIGAMDTGKYDSLDVADVKRHANAGTMSAKGDFFRLFAAAYNAGLLHKLTQRGYMRSDALANTLAERAPEVISSDAYQSLLTFWREWAYAWGHCGECRQ